MKIKIIVLAALMSFIFSACKEDGDTSCPGNPADYDITYELRADTAFLPYHGRDTLYFQVSDSLGNIMDTVTYVGYGKSYDRTYLEASNVNGCDYKYYGRNFAVKYISPDLPQHIDIYFQTVKSSSNITITFGNDVYTFTTAQLNGQGGFKYPSKEVAGQHFTNLIQVCSARLLNAAECDAHPFLANKSHGILVMDTKGYIVLKRLY